MGAPLLTATVHLAKLELVSNTLNFELPLLLADVRLNDSLLSMIGLSFTGHLGHDVSTAKVEIFIDIVTALFGMNFVGKVSISLHIVTVVISIILTTSTFVANHWRLELELF